MDRNFMFMMSKVFKLGTFLLFIYLMGCSVKKTEVAWDIALGGIGSQSSPRTADLNGDDILDIIIGAGRNEFDKSDQGILAINGKNGKILWQQRSRDQVFGSPSFKDVNGDAVPDVFIGGRSHQLYALDGKSGALIWEYQYSYENHPVLRHAKFNFYSGAFVPDQSGDGIDDFLISNGGNVLVGPHVEEGREPGLLMLFDAKTGEIIAADTMPDGRETYMSPLCFQIPEKEETFILFGSGGETLTGRLYLASIEDLINQDLGKAKIIASGEEEKRGFIAPPVLADITQDKIPDIVAITHGSTAYAIDGKDQKLLWKRRFPNTECSNSFAVGFFTPDDVPDFFTFVSEGEWPNNTRTFQILFNGKDGTIAFLDSMGCTGFSSPVTYDLNNDGIDEAIISINEWDCTGGFAEKIDEDNPITNKLIAVDFGKKSVYPIDQRLGFKNVFSTPVVHDLDGDGYLDIVHFQYYHTSAYINAFMGMQVKRISTNVPFVNASSWGAYMGTKGDGVFRDSRD